MKTKPLKCNHLFYNFYFTFEIDQPIEKAPVEQTAGEQALQQQSKTAKSLLGEFDLNEAGKLVQKRRPVASILDEELLLSEDEADNPPAAKKPALDNEAKETKSAAGNASEKSQSVDKANTNKPINKPPMQGGNNPQMKRKKVGMNQRSPSNNRPGNNGPMNMNMSQMISSLQDQMPRDMSRDGGDLFMRKRNFMDSDMSFDRQGDRGFSMSSNFMNDRQINNSMNSNNFGNNRDFGDDFSRRPVKNDGFNNFGNRSGANGGGNGGGGGGGGGGVGGGGRMFNRY